MPLTGVTSDLDRLASSSSSHFLSQKRPSLGTGGSSARAVRSSGPATPRQNLVSLIRRDSAAEQLSRPQLLAMGNGTVSVEPRVRRSSSQGSLVRSLSASLYAKDHSDSSKQSREAIETMIQTSEKSPQKLSKKPKRWGIVNEIEFHLSFFPVSFSKLWTNTARLWVLKWVGS